MGQVVWVVHQATSTRLMQPAPFVISLADWAMIAHMTFIEAGLCSMHILFRQPANLGHLFPLDRLGLNKFHFQIRGTATQAGPWQSCHSRR